METLNIKKNIFHEVKIAFIEGAHLSKNYYQWKVVFQQDVTNRSEFKYKKIQKKKKDLYTTLQSSILEGYDTKQE